MKVIEDVVVEEKTGEEMLDLEMPFLADTCALSLDFLNHRGWNLEYRQVMGAIRETPSLTDRIVSGIETQYEAFIEMSKMGFLFITEGIREELSDYIAMLNGHEPLGELSIIVADHISQLLDVTPTTPNLDAPGRESSIRSKLYGLVNKVRDDFFRKDNFEMLGLFNPSDRDIDLLVTGYIGQPRTLLTYDSAIIVMNELFGPVLGEHITTHSYGRPRSKRIEMMLDRIRELPNYA